MQIGFLTNCLHDQSLEQIIAWAGANGFQNLELAAWPVKGRGPNPDLDVIQLDEAGAGELLALAAEHGVAFTCVTYCENLLHRDPRERERLLAHVRRVIEAARLLNVDVVSTFIGRNETLTLEQNLDEMERVFAPLLKLAAERGVRLAIENCPMPGMQFEGLPGNIAYAPDLWDEMFRRLPHSNFGLNLDPSHLVWLGVDYLAAVHEYAPRIFHTHAKDTEIFPERRARASILNSGWDSWWRYRLPGLGEIDWRRWVEALNQIGYHGALSIEHEDPEWAGSEVKIAEGLLLAKQHLQASQPGV